VAKVILEKIYKSFPDRTKKSERETASAAKKEETRVNVLKAIDLTINDGEFMVLVGPSGCGKSTLLRTIAGLEELTGGSIWIGDRQVDRLLPKERDIAMVFQNYALYPHLSVYDNIAFGLRRMSRGIDAKASKSSLIDDWLVGLSRKLPKKFRYRTEKERAIAARVEQVAQLLQIEFLLKRLPKELSGGQKQRVALGRAIARNPQVFLMDEPLSNLDAKLRAETRSQIVKLQRQLGVTTIYVTHDQTEAMTMGDRIAVMNGGEIQQLAKPLEIYNRPANRFVAEFIGSPPMNFLSVRVESPLTVIHSQFHATLPQDWTKFLAPYNGQLLWLGIRPEHFAIAPQDANSLQVEVDLVEALGNETYIVAHPVEEPDSLLQIKIAPDERVRLGDRIWLSPMTNKVHLFDPQTGQAIWREER
jgi:multiple sugar transport system ATP-binding protein